MLEWVVAQAQRAEAIDEVVVVLGRAADEVRKRVDFGFAKVIDNPVFGEGCASSYRAGIGAVDARSDAIMILLGDQPGVGPEIIDKVAAVFRQGSNRIVLASYQGRNGHPMLFARPLFDKLVELRGDKAAWKLVDSNPDLIAIAELEITYPEDINTPEDAARLIGARQD